MLTRMRCFVILAAAVVSLSAQEVELGPAPRVDFEALKAGPQTREFSPAAAGGWLDTSKRTGGSHRVGKWNFR